MKPFKYTITVDHEDVILKILSQPDEWIAKSVSDRSSLVWKCQETGLLVRSASFPELSRDDTIFIWGISVYDNDMEARITLDDEDEAEEYAGKVGDTLALFSQYLSTAFEPKTQSFFD